MEDSWNSSESSHDMNGQQTNISPRVQQEITKDPETTSKELQGCQERSAFMTLKETGQTWDS